MRDDVPSKTACLVAGYRGLAARLAEPRLAELAPDPYGVPLAGWPYTLLDTLAALPVVGRLAMSRVFFWRAGACAMAARTRVLDDAVRDAVRGGGARQVLILGAGLDARALRLSHELRQLAGGEDVRFFEVDHPASQRAKLCRLQKSVVARGDGGAAASEHLRRVAYVAHNFEAQGAGATPLGEQLQAVGFDPTRKRTVVLMEGLLMYLSPPTVDALFASVAQLCASGSVVAFTYIARPQRRPSLRERLRRGAWYPFMLWLRFWAHEPWTFWGWASGAEVQEFLLPHRMRLLWSDSYLSRATQTCRLAPDDLPVRRLAREHCAVAERV